MAESSVALIFLGNWFPRTLISIHVLNMKATSRCSFEIISMLSSILQDGSKACLSVKPLPAAQKAAAQGRKAHVSASFFLNTERCGFYNPF